MFDVAPPLEQRVLPRPTAEDYGVSNAGQHPKR
jgi:hypothetical protein